MRRTGFKGPLQQYLGCFHRSYHYGAPARFNTRERFLPLRAISRPALITSVALSGALFYYFTWPASREKSQHYIHAIERSGRVLVTLLVCVNDYRRTLKVSSEDDKEWQSILAACHKRCALRTLKTMEKNGSIFIKLGQHLSSMNYLLPSEWTETFVPLQDHCPVSDYESVADMFLQETGQSIHERFDYFHRDPIGAASLAQVHLARMKNGHEDVAVKVQHPALKEWVPLDLALTRITFSTLKWFFPEYDLEWLSNEMDLSLPQELDFSMEGQFALGTKKHFENMNKSPLLIPDVKWHSKRILIMEYLAGHRLDDLEFLDANGIDRDEVSAALATVFNEMIFGDTLLHCDPHGGNLAIRKNSNRWGHNFDIILYDHGLYRDIPLQLRRDYAKLWLAVLDSDEQRMREYSFRVAGITDDMFPLFASAITGRDYLTATKSVVTERSSEEKQIISGAMGPSLLADLVKLLGNVPRIILLILKTNDLTRSLDENLKTREGPLRNFLILARYCSRTVYEERKDFIIQEGRVMRPSSLLRLCTAWASFIRVELKLTVYEWGLLFKRIHRLIMA